MADPNSNAPARRWTARVRRAAAGEVIVTLGGVDHVMSDAQAERLEAMLISLSQGFYNDSGEVRL